MRGKKKVSSSLDLYIMLGYIHCQCCSEQLDLWYVLCKTFECFYGPCMYLFKKNLKIEEQIQKLGFSSKKKNINCLFFHKLKPSIYSSFLTQVKEMPKPYIMGQNETGKKSLKSEKVTHVFVSQKNISIFHNSRCFSSVSH